MSKNFKIFKLLVRNENEKDTKKEYKAVQSPISNLNVKPKENKKIINPVNNNYIIDFDTPQENKTQNLQTPIKNNYSKRSSKCTEKDKENNPHSTIQKNLLIVGKILSDSPQVPTSKKTDKSERFSKKKEEPVPTQTENFDSFFPNLIMMSIFKPYKGSESTVNFKENYIIGKKIGQGAYAIVRLAVFKPTNRKVAIKVYKKESLNEERRKKSVRNEIEILSKMSHKNIIKLIEVVETRNHLNLVLDYIKGDSLYSYLKKQNPRKLSEENTKEILIQLAEALDYCHKRNIAHRDIKLENILLDIENNPILIDFGFSTNLKEKIKMFCGTPSYMSPEIILRKECYGPPCDMWAFGVLTYALLSGTFPFKELYTNIIKGSYLFPEYFSEQSKNFIKSLLSLNPKYRPSAENIISHSYFKEIKKYDVPIKTPSKAPLNSPFKLLETAIFSNKNSEISKNLKTETNTNLNDSYLEFQNRFSKKFLNKNICNFPTNYKKTNESEDTLYMTKYKNTTTITDIDNQASIDSAIIESITKLGFEKSVILENIKKKESKIYSLYREKQIAKDKIKKTIFPSKINSFHNNGNPSNKISLNINIFNNISNTCPDESIENNNNKYNNNFSGNKKNNLQSLEKILSKTNSRAKSFIDKTHMIQKQNKLSGGNFLDISKRVCTDSCSPLQKNFLKENQIYLNTEY